ncbi:MAG: Crp/Fnr family transcriptional regulator [Pseudolabrys sp.]
MTSDTGNGSGRQPRFDHEAFIARYQGAAIARQTDGAVVYRQGEPADAAFYIVNGAVKVTVLSEQGKEAVLALRKAGEFFGEECLHPHRRRNSTVTATTDCDIVRLDRDAIVRALGDDTEFGQVFLQYILHQNDKLREDLIDQLFNSSEKRLARILLTLANSGSEDRASDIAIPVTQETLASMVGTTRPRINQFMTKFRRLGYIDYDDRIRVYNSLTKVIADDKPQTADC